MEFPFIAGGVFGSLLSMFRIRETLLHLASYVRKFDEKPRNENRPCESTNSFVLLPTSVRLSILATRRCRLRNRAGGASDSQDGRSSNLDASSQISPFRHRRLRMAAASPETTPDAFPRCTLLPPPPQSIAALLPAEILDCIFSHFYSAYSLDAQIGSRIDRDDNLIRFSLVAPAWNGTARRFLRRVTIASFEHLGEEVPDWVGGAVRSLKVGLGGAILTKRQKESAPRMLLKVLQKLPSLRQLSLSYFPFSAFDAADLTTFRTTQLLPHLQELRIYGDGQIQRMIPEIIATSGGRISNVTCSLKRADSQVHHPLDFGGQLRCLESNTEFFQHLLLADHGSLEGYAGLEAMEVDLMAVTGQEGRMESFCRVIGPTLRKLTIDGATGPIAGYLSSLTHLTTLSLGHLPDLLAILNHLPPSLSTLSLLDDSVFHQLLPGWTANPSTVPRSLKVLRIRAMPSLYTLYYLPPFDKLVTVCPAHRWAWLDTLRTLAGGSVSVKVLELSLNRWDDWENEIREECARLGTSFRKGVPRKDW